MWPTFGRPPPISNTLSVSFLPEISLVRLLEESHTQGEVKSRPNSGTRALSAILEIIIGIIFLGNNIFLAFSLPVIFAMWVLIESVIITVNSFDYQRVGFPAWWVILLLGICGIVLGVLGLRNPDVTAATLSTLIGLGVISTGAAYLFALLGITRFEKKVDGLRREMGIDEQ